jgi:hypothetical protein
VSPVKYELGFIYIPEDCFLHRHRRENLKSYNRDFVSLHLSTTASSDYFLPLLHYLN